MSDTHDGRLFGEDQPCYGCGPKHPHGFHLQFVRDGDDVVTRFVPGEHHQGPPGIMHGGLVTTLADEVAAWAVVLHAGKFGFTTTLQGRFHKAVRCGAEIEARARVTAPGRRILGVSVAMTQEGTTVWTGSFQFAVLERAAAEKLLGAALPEEWSRWTR